MKFRDPETGEVYDADDALDSVFECNCCNPGTCPIGKEAFISGYSCADYTESHPHEAARLMGFEVVEDEKEDSMFYSQSLEVLNPAKAIKEAKEKGANMDKPRICEVLGFDVEEQFYIADSYCNPYHITPEGLIEDKDGDVQDCIALDLINHPDRIIRKPRWTEQEVEDAKDILRLLEDAHSIKKYAGDIMWICNSHNVTMVNANAGMFPSLRPGESVTLDEIIGGAE